MKTKIPLATAREVAGQLVEQLTDACKRIEVAELEERQEARRSQF